jgi:hypothetical protein
MHDAGGQCNSLYSADAIKRPQVPVPPAQPKQSTHCQRETWVCLCLDSCAAAGGDAAAGGGGAAAGACRPCVEAHGHHHHCACRQDQQESNKRRAGQHGSCDGDAIQQRPLYSS